MFTKKPDDLVNLIQNFCFPFVLAGRCFVIFVADEFFNVFQPFHQIPSSTFFVSLNATGVFQQCNNFVIRNGCAFRKNPNGLGHFLRDCFQQGGKIVFTNFKKNFGGPTTFGLQFESQIERFVLRINMKRAFFRFKVEMICSFPAAINLRAAQACHCSVPIVAQQCI
ncbi:hypothetical protein CKO29_03705 [Allochromatium vinosum]|nr:hypothetical protein [Allochromatium vinosum]